MFIGTNTHSNCADGDLGGTEAIYDALPDSKH